MTTSEPGGEHTLITRIRRTLILQTIPPRPDAVNRHQRKLATTLYRASTEFARRAVTQYASNDSIEQLEAAIDAGAAAEFLVRAVLVAHDPTLIAEGEYARVALSRASVDEPIDPRKLKTVAILQALKHLEIVAPSAQVTADVRYIMDTRNAAMHAALVDDSLGETVARLAVVVDRLHEFIDRTTTSYWGPELIAAVEALKDDRMLDVQRRLEAKYARAALELARTVGALRGVEREALLTVLESRARSIVFDDSLIEQKFPCPVCKHTGTGTFMWVREAEPEPDDEGRLRFVLYPYIDGFLCSVCGLALTADEAAAAGVVADDDLVYEYVEDDDDEPDWTRGIPGVEAQEPVSDAEGLKPVTDPEARDPEA